MKIIIRLVIACFFILYCHTNVRAQVIADSVYVPLEDVAPAESLADTITADTILNRYEFETDDSMGVYKRDKDFGYMKYLDSLLRKTKDLTIDTFSVGYGSSGSKRKVRDKSRQVKVPQLNIFSNPVVKVILWIAAIFLIGFIIYKLFLGEHFFRRDRTYKNTDPQKEEEIQDASAYDKLIASAVVNRNYRLAIRYLYLQTLQKLTETGLLQFSADKTNYQYVNELRGKPYQNDFAAITLNYEYVWYGKFDINEDVYKRLSGEYKSFHQKI